jgi:hypothetical protein
MGEILSSRVFEDKIVFTVQVDEQESLALAGRIKHVHLFTLKECNQVSEIVTRGRENRVKYFIMPPRYRLKPLKKIKVNSAQVLHTDTKVIFIYLCEK